MLNDVRLQLFFIKKQKYWAFNKEYFNFQIYNFFLHLNIRSINKNFENFKFLSNLNFSFSIICFPETWLNDSNVDNSNYELPNYVSVHQIRNHYKGGGVSVYIHKNFEFKIRNDLSINSKDIESIGVELLYEKRRNTLFNVVYRQPNRKSEISWI